MYHGAHATRWYDPSKCTFQKVAHALLKDSKHAMTSRSKNRALRAKQKHYKASPSSSPSPWLAQTAFGSYLREISATDRCKVSQQASRPETNRSVQACVPQRELVLPTLPQSNPPLFICTAGQPNQVWDPPPSDHEHLSAAGHARTTSSVLPSTAHEHREASPCSDTVRRLKKFSASATSARLGDATSRSTSVPRMIRSTMSAPSGDGRRNRSKTVLSTCAEQEPAIKLSNEERVNEILRRPGGVSSDVELLDTPVPTQSKDHAAKKQRTIIGQECAQTFKRSSARRLSVRDDDSTTITPRTALRRELCRKAGDIASAVRVMDVNNSGLVSVTEFISGLESLQINHARVTGVSSASALFKMFDTERNGELKLDEIYGDWKTVQDEIRRTTIAMWNQWCDQTTSQAEQRLAKTRGTRMDSNDILIREKRLAKQQEQKQKLRYLFAQGLRSVVSREFLAKDTTTHRRLEGDSRLKREKKIERVMGDMTSLRRDLQMTRMSMEDIMKSPEEVAEEARRKELEQKQFGMKKFNAEELSDFRAKLQAGCTERDPPAAELADMFEQTKLGVSTEVLKQNAACRQVAKKYQLCIHHVESIKSGFDF